MMTSVGYCYSYRRSRIFIKIFLNKTMAYVTRTDVFEKKYYLEQNDLIIRI